MNWEAEVAVSRDRAIALQPDNKSKTLSQKQTKESFRAKQKTRVNKKETNEEVIAAAHLRDDKGLK